MAEKKKDPIKDMIDTIVDDYKDAYKTVKSKNSKKNQDPLHMSFLQKKCSYKFYDSMVFLNKKCGRLGVPLVLAVDYGIWNHYDVAKFFLQQLDHDIKLNYELQIFLINLILVGITTLLYYSMYQSSKSNLNDYLQKRFRLTEFTSKDFQQPQFLKYIKTKTKKIVEIDYHFSTTLTLDYWTKKKNELEIALKTHILKIQNYNSDNNLIVVKTSNHQFDYYTECKNVNNALSDRIKYGFNYLGMEIEVVNTIEKQYQTVIEFNSRVNRTKVLGLKDDLKHRTSIANLQLQANTKTDYKALISKKIGIIDYNKLLKEVELNKNNNLLVGIDNSSNVHILNIFKMTHAIVAGSSGKGKSNIINGLLTSLYYSKLENVVYCLIDPKKAELKKYRDINNTFYAGHNEDILAMLKALEDELTRRENIIDSDKYIKDIEAYNTRYKDDPMSYIVVAIEEIADLMCKTATNKDFFKEFDRITQRLVQAGRAYGFRLFLCTQQPKADILNTTIKLSAITRMAFGTDTTGNSRLILDNNKAHGLNKGELILQHDGADIFLKAPLVEENIEQVEIIITELEKMYQNVNNHVIKKTIQSIQKAIDMHITTIQPDDKNHTNHTNNYTVLSGNKENQENTNTNLVGANFSYAIEGESDLLDYYQKVADSNGKLPSVAKTEKTTNKSRTTIQKWRTTLIQQGKIVVVGQTAYLQKESKEA